MQLEPLRHSHCPLPLVQLKERPTRPSSSSWSAGLSRGHTPPGGGVVVAPPRPPHPPLAAVVGVVEVAGGTGGVVDDGGGMEAVGDDNVGVHGRDVDVVDVGGLGVLRRIPEELQLLGNLRIDLIVVGDLPLVDPPLHLDCERHVPVNVLDKPLEPLRPHVKFVLNVRSVDARLQALHLAADVTHGIEEVALRRELF